MHRLASILFLGLALACRPTPDAAAVRSLRLEVEVDVARARAIGWTSADDDGVVKLVHGMVQERLTALGHPVEVEAPAGARFHLAFASLDGHDAERIQGALRSLGVCEFLFVAEEEGRVERPRLEAWRRAHPQACLEELNRLPREAGGPPAGLAWFQTLSGTDEGPPARVEPLLLRLTTDLADHFAASDLARTHTSTDAFGYPALGFEIDPDRQDDFARVTAAHVGQRMAIVIEGQVRSAPSLSSRLKSGGIIEGRFTPDELERLHEAITRKAGPLRVVEVR